MFANQAGHFKHADLLLAKNLEQFVIGIDIAFVLCVLQIVGFDVVPHFFDDFCAGQGSAANNGG